jgi:hypothetical protein
MPRAILAERADAARLQAKVAGGPTPGTLEYDAFLDEVGTLRVRAGQVATSSAGRAVAAAHAAIRARFRSSIATVRWMAKSPRSAPGYGTAFWQPPGP